MTTKVTKKSTKRRRRSERNAAMFDDATVEFIQAIDAYRRRFDRSFPAWSEVLRVVHALGYRQVEEPQRDQEGHLKLDAETAGNSPVQEAMEEGRPVSEDD